MAKCTRERACGKGFGGNLGFIKKLAGRLVFYITQ